MGRARTSAVTKAITAAQQRVAALTAEIDDIVVGTEAANADDEHDPEGATIAFERAQLITLLDEARVRLDELELAAAKGSAYGLCETCGEAIAPKRLEALPGARQCIACASTKPLGRA